VLRSIDPPAGEEKAIDQFATLMQQAVGSVHGLWLVKTLPRYLVQILIKTGLIHVISSEWACVSPPVWQVVLQHMQGATSVRSPSLLIFPRLVPPHWRSHPTGFFRLSQRSVKSVVEGLTTNNDLRRTLMYCWGDYGTPPKVRKANAARR